MKAKKAQVDPMQIIILFIILAVVAGIVIYIFITSSGKQVGVIEKKIGGLEKDTDGDGLADTIDPCPCDTNNNLPCSIKCSIS